MPLIPTAAPCCASALASARRAHLAPRFLLAFLSLLAILTSNNSNNSKGGVLMVAGEEILNQQVGDEGIITLKSPEPKSPQFPPIPPCLDNATYEGPNGPSCALNAPLCMVPEVMENCMVTCEGCPPILTDLPPTFGFCLTFVNLVNTEDTLALFLATCVDISYFQVSITVDLNPVTAAVTGSGGLATNWTVSGVDGIVTGMNPTGLYPILAGTFNTLTTLTADDGSNFPVGVTCVVDLNLKNFYGQKVLAFSPCTVENQCFTGDFTPPPPAPPAPPPAPMIISDPHFNGFHNQHYDVTGVAGLSYNLVADALLHINAEFATAYTTGLFIDPVTSEVHRFRPRGTWMSSIGIVVQTLSETAEEEQHVLVLSTEPSSFEEICQLKPKECFNGGSVQLDGVELWAVGSVDLGSNTAIESSSNGGGSSSKIILKNMRSFGRVEIVLPDLHASLDHVPPPKEWEVPAEQVQEMSHVNIKFHSITVAEDANGIIGCTVRVKKDHNGQPLLTAYDKNGGGILDGPVSAYEVDSITDASFPRFSNEWVQSL